VVGLVVGGVLDDDARFFGSVGDGFVVVDVLVEAAHGAAVVADGFDLLGAEELA